MLEGADLALAGTAMAITFALPFLALSYLIRVDGRVLFYLISLGVALIPAIVLGSGSLNPQAGTVFACLLLALPAVVSAVLCGLLSAKAVEKTLQHLLAASAGVAVLLALSIGFAAPNFSIEYLLRELPPELHVNGGLIYAVLLFYSVQLTLLYFVVSRIARFCLDESTQQFVGQHMLFHWMLTMTSFILVGAVHGELATGWGTAPILLGGLTAVVSLGFNSGHSSVTLSRVSIACGSKIETCRIVILLREPSKPRQIGNWQAPEDFGSEVTANGGAVSQPTCHRAERRRLRPGPRERRCDRRRGCPVVSERPGRREIRSFATGHRHRRHGSKSASWAGLRRRPAST